MSAKIEAKAKVVEDIKDRLSRSKGTVMVDYKGVTVEEDTELRKQFRAASIDYKVLKNTLINRAAKELNLDDMSSFLAGPTAIAFSYDDPVAGAKIISDFIKKTSKMDIKVGVLDGKVIDKDEVKALASLPSKEVLIAKMLGSMNAPISGLVQVLNGTLRSFVYTLNAIKEKKEA